MIRSSEGDAQRAPSACASERHRAQLEDLELAAALTDPVLAVEDGPAVAELDRDRSGGDERHGDHGCEQADGDVHRPLRDPGAGAEARVHEEEEPRRVDLPDRDVPEGALVELVALDHPHGQIEAARRDQLVGVAAGPEGGRARSPDEQVDFVLGDRGADPPQGLRLRVLVVGVALADVEPADDLELVAPADRGKLPADGGHELRAAEDGDAQRLGGERHVSDHLDRDRRAAPASRPGATIAKANPDAPAISSATQAVTAAPIGSSARTTREAGIRRVG